MSAALKQKDINFYKVYYEKPERSANEKIKARLIAIPVLLVLAMGAVFGFFTYKIHNLQVQIAPTAQFLEGATEKEMLDYAKKAQGQLSVLLSKKTSLSLAIAAIESYPVLTKAEFSKIDSCFAGSADIVEMSFDKSTAQVIFNGRTSTANIAADCTERLRKTGLFSELGYYGYASDKDGVFNFEVTCVLKAVANDE
ncbi:MAG: hypothetical protein RR724_05665 [Hydrogenoanaerobacterium sp.]